MSSSKCGMDGSILIQVYDWPKIQYAIHASSWILWIRLVEWFQRLSQLWYSWSSLHCNVVYNIVNQLIWHATLFNTFNTMYYLLYIVWRLLNNSTSCSLIIYVVHSYQLWQLLLTALCTSIERDSLTVVSPVLQVEPITVVCYFAFRYHLLCMRFGWFAQALRAVQIIFCPNAPQHPSTKKMPPIATSWSWGVQGVLEIRLAHALHKAASFVCGIKIVSFVRNVIKYSLSPHPNEASGPSNPRRWINERWTTSLPTLLLNTHQWTTTLTWLPWRNNHLHPAYDCTCEDCVEKLLLFTGHQQTTTPRTVYSMHQ